MGNSFNHIRKVFNVPHDIRIVMYAINALEAVNLILRKYTKKDFENAIIKLF